MGTNYYVVTEPCAHCGRGGEKLHIGKSSAGWVFALNTHPDLGLTSIAEWMAFLPGKTIKDEYDRIVSFGEMMEAIACRDHPTGLSRSPDARHGEGTWDYHRGDFC